jgi:phosphohistidine swiveling domain-containing protein
MEPHRFGETETFSIRRERGWVGICAGREEVEVSWLMRTAETDPAIVGGKAAQLARLERLGLPVPPARVVPVQVMERALADSGLLNGVQRALEDHDLRAARDLQVQVCSMKGPDLQAWTGAPGALFAVRSSAVVEDGGTRSFAGVFESELGVAHDQLQAAVRRVWASRLSPRAVLLHEAGDPVGMAVVVQPMLAPVASGVMFTINPASGSWREMVVEAVWGLAEPLVSGQVEPQAWTVRRPGWLPARGVRLFGRVALSVVEASTPRLMRRTVARDGLVREPVPDELQGSPTLSERQLLRLCRLGLRVEAALGGPQDIEWALLADGSLCLLQARPVTARSVGDRGTTLWTRRFFGERFPEPVSPMSWSLVAPALEHLIAYPQTTERWLGGEPALQLVAGRPFVNTTAFRHLLFKAPGSAPPEFMLELLPPAEARSWRSRFAVMPDLAVYGAFLAETWRERRWERFAWNPIDNPAAWRLLERRLQDVFASPLPAQPVAARAEVTRLEQELRAYLGVHVPSLLFANLAWQLLDGLLAEHAPDRRAGWMEAVAVSPPGNRTMALHHDLAALRHMLGEAGVRALSAGEELAPGGAAAVAGFLARHGHRARVGWEAFSPRWRDDPRALGAALADLAVQPAEGLDLFERALAELTGALPLAAATVARGLVWLLRRYLLLRENQRWTFERLMMRLQDVVVVAASPLGLPAADLSLLTWVEVQSHLDAGTRPDPWLLVERRAAQARAEAAVVPVFLGVDEAPVGAARRVGRGLSPGRAEGVIVRLRPGQTSVPLGSVVVVDALDPSATPMLAQAAAVVCALGGMLSHGAVLAREYHRPMVGDLEGGLVGLDEGRRVVVDGTRGLVWLVDQP